MGNNSFIIHFCKMGFKILSFRKIQFMNLENINFCSGVNIYLIKILILEICLRIYMLIKLCNVKVKKII